ncbi:hypothetical protein FF100_22130 [Methylobacterium terricola]|uniref:Uncharacterized protein n=1 Tax=Methylobacterium terricola TaxID=2583531 RepID=A0A5C4LCD0_9HYPH|nr:hypothetical protein [Methylobacterium terricola]TNC10852.1 hypothetical protein FF100_22130 [Methylobacterium terricola]
MTFNSQMVVYNEDGTENSQATALMRIILDRFAVEMLGRVAVETCRPKDVTTIIVEALSASLIHQFEEEGYEGCAWRIDETEPDRWREPTLHTYERCAKLKPVAAAVLKALKDAGVVR